MGVTLEHTEIHWFKNNVGQSQDGTLGGHGIHISSQLGQLPGTSGGPRTPNLGRGGG